MVAMFLFTVLAGLAYLVPFAAADVCGLVGTNSDKISYYMGNFFYKGPTTFALCAAYCKLDAPKCKSFRYSFWSDSNAQYCEYFDSALFVVQNLFLYLLLTSLENRKCHSGQHVAILVL